MVVKERGQSLVLFTGLLVAFLALVSLVLDGGLYFWHWRTLQVDIDNACISAALAESRGASGYSAFTASLQSNEVQSFYYEPYEVGTDGLVIRGIQWHWSGKSFLAGLQGPHSFYLAQFMGITHMDLAVRTRCTIPRIRMLPIAVQEPWVLTAIGNPAITWPILGQGAEAVTAAGNDFRGAVIPQVWCANSNCNPRTFFEPAPEVNSSNILKDIVRDTILGNAGFPFVPIGGRVPQPSGTSSHFLTKAMVDAGYEVGDQIMVMVYSGIIDRPDPSNGNWENLEVIYYAIAEITEIDANTVHAFFVKAPITTNDEILFLTTPITIPWDWLGLLP